MRRMLANIILAFVFVSMTCALAEESLDNAIIDLGSEDADIRRQASERLIEAGATSVPSLISILSTGSAVVGKEAALVLGAIGDARAVKPLVAALDDGDGDLRWAAIWALVQIGQPSVADLINSFENGASDANAGAEIALAKIGQPAVPQLINALASKSTNIRRQSARLLGRIGDPTSAEALKKLLQDENQAVRSEASLALTKITEE